MSMLRGLERVTPTQRPNVLTCVVDEFQYALHPQPLAAVTESCSSAEPLPVVVFPVKSTTTLHDVLAFISMGRSYDDVFSSSFKRNLVVHCGADAVSEAMLAVFRNEPSKFSSVYAIGPGCQPKTIPPGPYFLLNGMIHQAYRLYPDELDSFVFGVLPEDALNPKRYFPFPILGSTGIYKLIPVPSRLYTTSIEEKPLAGARVAIKDIFRLEGTTTTMTCRAWIRVHEPDEESADYVKHLIKLGAVIVGKTRMTSFGSSEEAPDQWVDFHSPINPRGDGYQRPSGTSPGASTALAGYPWLDFSVATNTAGALRAPSTASGLFSLRTSLGSTSMKGVPITSHLFDVVGHYSRNLDDLEYMVSETCNLRKSYSQFPRTILYPTDFYPLADETQQVFTEHAVTALELFLGERRRPFSFAEEWDKNPPEEARGLSLFEYTEKSAFWALCHDFYHNFSEFREGYRSRADDAVVATPAVAFRWDIGKDVTPKEYSDYSEQLRVFRKWFSRHFMGAGIRYLSDAILVMPWGGPPDPEYRYKPSPPPETFPTITQNFIAPILQAPQLVLPFAQTPFESELVKQRGRDRFLTFAISLIGAPGSDLMLIDLAKACFRRYASPMHTWPGTATFPHWIYPASKDSTNADASMDAVLTSFRSEREIILHLHKSLEK